MSAMQFGKTDINIQNKIHTMKMTKTKLAKGFTLVELLVVIAIIAALAALSTPVVLKQQKKASLAEAVNNAKQIGYLMKDYDDSFGNYPLLTNAQDTTLPATITTSNQIWGKFFQLSLIDVEEVFYAKTSWNRKPDGDADTTARFCAAGESGFGYISGLSASNNGRAPVVVAPQAAAGNSVTFDGGAFGGSMVYLCVDGSVQTAPVKLDGTVSVQRGGAAVNLMTFTSVPLYGGTGAGSMVGSAAIPAP